MNNNNTTDMSTQTGEISQVPLLDKELKQLIDIGCDESLFSMEEPTDRLSISKLLVLNTHTLK